MNIWLPNGVSYEAYRVDRAVREYDERLMFGRNEDTGDWCVFVRMPSPRDPFPVFGFGNRIPKPDEALARIKEGHLVAHKERIWREVVDSQKKYKADLAYKSDQAGEDSAERAEHLMRKHGKSPIIKSLRKGVSDSDA